MLPRRRSNIINIFSSGAPFVNRDGLIVVTICYSVNFGEWALAINSVEQFYNTFLTLSKNKIICF